jgi:hypothetical protein
MGDQMLQQTDAKVFKKYSQMRLQTKREALAQINCRAGDSEGRKRFDTEETNESVSITGAEELEMGRPSQIKGLHGGRSRDRTVEACKAQIEGQVSEDKENS